MPVAVCLGEALIDLVADRPGVSLGDCPGFRKAPGGAPANVAVGLARLGVPTAFLGKVGDDPFGRFLARTLAEAGVDTRWLCFDREAKTALAFVSLSADARPEFLFYRNPSADMLYCPDEVDPAAFEGCRLFHFGSITLIQEPSRSATLAALSTAREHGARVSYDPNLRPALWPDLDTARREILAALPLADLVKVSEEEAEFLTGAGAPAEQAAWLLERGPSIVAVTRGAAGCLLASGSACVAAPGFAVEAVDTTGAGDAFAAALLARLLELGWAGRGTRPPELDAETLAEVARFANAAGALACRVPGAIPALPDRAAVDRLLAAGLAGA